MKVRGPLLLKSVRRGFKRGNAAMFRIVCELKGGTAPTADLRPRRDQTSGPREKTYRRDDFPSASSDPQRLDLVARFFAVGSKP